MSFGEKSKVLWKLMKIKMTSLTLKKNRLLVLLVMEL